MQTGWGTLWSIFGILFLFSVTATALGQQRESESQTIKVSENINLVELSNNVKSLSTAVQDLTKTVEKLSENVEELNKNVGTLNTKVAALDERTKGVNESVKTLNTKVAALDERTNGNTDLLHIILGAIVTIFAAMVVFFLTQGPFKRGKGNSENRVVSTQTTQENENEVAPVDTARVNESKAPPTNTAQVSGSKTTSANQIVNEKVINTYYNQALDKISLGHVEEGKQDLQTALHLSEMAELKELKAKVTRELDKLKNRSITPTTSTHNRSPEK